MRYLLALILTVAAACAQQPLTSQELAKRHFLLSFSGVLCASNHSPFNKLEVGNMANRFVVQRVKDQLDEWWGITDRDSFLDCVMSLVKQGHRKSYEEQAMMIKTMTSMDFTSAMKQYSGKEDIMYRIYLAYNYNNMFTNDMLLSWDLTRVVYLVRNAYTAGYIAESEAWRILEGLELDKKMKANYKSWEETGSHYVIGRNYWSLTQTKSSGDNIDLAATILSEMRDSPWNVYPGIEFNGKPMPDYHQDDIKLPEVEIKIPENTINNPDDYPDAIVVSTIEELKEAQKKAPTGGTIFLKSGIYELKLPLFIKKELKIIGQERDKVIFSAGQFHDCIMVISPNAVIDSITITATKKQAKDIAAGIRVTKPGCVIRNCKIDNTNRRAVVITDGQAELLVENCLFRGNYEGIVCNAGKLTVKNSLIGGSAQSGIRLIGNVAAKLEGNVVRNNTYNGIYCESQEVCVIKNNIISGNKRAGILVHDTSVATTVSNNISFDNVHAGIWVTQSSNTLIQENTCYFNGNCGVIVSDANNIEVVGNKCYQNKNAGIYANGFDNKLSKNICARNSNGIKFCGQGVLSENVCNENLHPGISLTENADAVLESNITQRNMYCGIEVSDQAKAVMKKNISDNNYWAGLGIYGGQASVLLEGNVFKDNGAWGVVCLDGAAKPKSDGDVFEGNYRGNDIEVKTNKSSYLSRFKKLY